MGIEHPTVAAMVMVGALAAHGIAADEASTQGDGADSYQDRWGPAAGDAMPMFSAEDQDGNVRDLASLSGERGLVLVVSRSAVW